MSSTDANQHATTFTYGPAGNQTRYTDGNGHNWITTYNSWNLPESQVEPATSAYPTAPDSTFTMAYDAAGRPVTSTAPGGVTLTYGYDPNGNLTSKATTGLAGAAASTVAESNGQVQLWGTRSPGPG